MENLVELPDCMKYIWKYFTDLNKKRTGTGYGPLSIQYSEILAYFTLFNIEYDPIEVQLIMLVDDIAVEYFNEEIKKENNKPAK